MNAVSSKKYTILIVENDSSLRFLLEKAMQKADYQTVSVAKQSDISDVLNQYSIDLILLDIITNHWEDFNTCQDIRQHFDRPIVVLSARSSPSAQAHATRLGASAYLTKPIRLSELQLCVESLLSVTSA